MAADVGERQSRPLLELFGITKHFPAEGGRSVRAVDGVDLAIERGETFGLVGESGSGKSTLGRVINRISPATSGRIVFDGEDVTNPGRGRAKRLTRQIQMIFQDPYSSLNPRMTVAEVIREGLDIHRVGSRAERADMVRTMMRRVGLDPDLANRFPHEFSGGQRQRIAIARALVVQPAVVICDEPISALDVSIQGQVVNLLRDLQRRDGLTYLFVAHDLRMVKYISDHVGVMYLGRVVETAPTAELFDHPLHPYTRALLSSVPIPDPVSERARVEESIEGEMPSPFERIAGCAFRSRCPHATAACARMRPELTEPAGAAPGHRVMCTLHGTPTT